MSAWGHDGVAHSNSTMDRHEKHGGKGGETLQEWSSLIGIVTAIVGNVLIALAMNVQRYAHTRLHKERLRVRQRARTALKRASPHNGNYGSITRSGNDITDEEQVDNAETDPLVASHHSGESTARSQEAEDADESKVTSTYLKSPYWWLGQILITLGETGNFLAYGFAPASIVSPLGVVALIANCIIAPVMFHETFRQRDFWGVVIAVGGVVTVVLSAKQEETKLDPHAVWGAITTLAFEIYMGITVCLILLLMWASSRYGRRTILIDLGLVGLFGGYTALSTKGVSSMLSSSLWRAFTTPVTYVLILILLGTAIMQIRYVNKALQRFDSTQVIPTQFVLFTLCVILGSAILYRDFERFTAEQAGKFIGGCLLTFFGVFLITSGREYKDHDEDENLLAEDEEVEENIGLFLQEGAAAPDNASHGTGPDGFYFGEHSKITFAHPTEPASSSLAGQKTASYFPDGEGGSPSRENQPLLTTTVSWDSGLPPLRGLRTISADTVMLAYPDSYDPDLGPTSIPSTPLRDPQYRLSYPVRPQTPRVVTAPPPRTPGSRQRRPFISPSPLSSTVTTVMKDAFLREDAGTRLKHRSSMRRLRSSIRASLFFGDGDSEDPTLVEDDAPASAFPDTGGGAHAEVLDMPYRSRSMSDTLGDFFRPKKKKRKDGDPGEEAATDVEEEGAEAEQRE